MVKSASLAAGVAELEQTEQTEVYALLGQRETGKVMDLFLIRHAQSQNNARPAPQRVADPGITQIGSRQAERLAPAIEDLGLTHIFTSPFLRTLQTAAVLQQRTSLTPQVKTELHEVGGCYHGHLPEQKTGAPGMNCEQINEAFPDFEIVSDIHSTGWWGSKPFEDSAMASVRAGELLCWTQEKFGHTDERIAFVTHADIKELILEQVHNGPLPCAFNTAVTEVQIATDAWRLVEHNCVAHLPLELHTT